MRRLFKRLPQLLWRTCSFPVLLWRCYRLPTGRPVLFNHTERVLKDGQTVKPLYLNPTYFDERWVVVEKFKQDYTVPLDYPVIPAWVILDAAVLLSYLSCGRYTREHILTSLYQAIWRVLQPSAVFFVVWYAYPFAVRAAKSCGIQTIDLQHGIVYPNHPHYDRRTPTNHCYPDVCWVYGQYWQQLLQRAGWAPSAVHVCGYYLSVQEMPAPDIKGPYILYTTQAGYHAPLIAHLSALSQHPDWGSMPIVVALHPMDDARAYAPLSALGLPLIQHQTYRLLQHAVVHVSLFSTLLWEACRWDVPSYILPQTDRTQALQDLVDLGVARWLTEGAWPTPWPFAHPEASQALFDAAPHNILETA